MTTLSVRVDSKVKKAAGKVFADLGLDLSTGVKIFLQQVITEKGLPFTPSKNPAVLRAKWDREVADALTGGRVYWSAKDALKDL